MFLDGFGVKKVMKTQVKITKSILFYKKCKKNEKKNVHIDSRV